MRKTLQWLAAQARSQSVQGTYGIEPTLPNVRLYAILEDIYLLIETMYLFLDLLKCKPTVS